MERERGEGGREERGMRRKEAGERGRKEKRRMERRGREEKGMRGKRKEGGRKKVKGGRRESGGKVETEWREDERKDKSYIECCPVCLLRNHCWMLTTHQFQEDKVRM